MKSFQIHPDIRKAETIPSWFYYSDECFAMIKEKIFTCSWQWIGDTSMVALENMAYPFSFMENYIDEPMLLVRNAQSALSVLSNVCTHRGNIIMHHPGRVQKLNCLYHGRRFSLEGQMEFMPQFKEVENFPRACDHLHRFPLEKWGKFLFTSIHPAYSFQPVIQAMQERVGFLPLDSFVLNTASSKDYLVHANWALYCDNYLEGFHIPFVHKDLNALLDYGRYETVLYDRCNLQIGYAEKDSEYFDLPEDHLDHGQKIAAYYFWIFPNMMFNFYPWGLSINIVKPMSKEKTRVTFLTYLGDSAKMPSGSQALIDKVEREDEFVVEGVFKGMKSRIYERGRYSTTMEKGVHHFHKLLESHLFET